MTLSTLKRLGIALAVLPALALGAEAAPVLRGDVTVSAPVVTVGDLFADAGDSASRPIFRAPAPGTAGYVDIDAVRTAAMSAGVTEFDASGLTRVRVARAGSPITEADLDAILADAMSARGLLPGGATPKITFGTPVPALYAAASNNPATLDAFSYQQGNGSFYARFNIAGSTRPVELGGRIDLVVDAPYLVRTLPSGSVIGAGDIEMRPTSLAIAQSGQLLGADEIVGKVLQHQSHAGLLLRPRDIGAPQLVGRNQAVTIIFRNGPLTLTARGQALNSASEGEPVAVLNMMSRKVIHGVATASGTVEVGNTTLNVAGL